MHGTQCDVCGTQCDVQYVGHSVMYGTLCCTVMGQSVMYGTQCNVQYVGHHVMYDTM